MFHAAQSQRGSPPRQPRPLPGPLACLLAAAALAVSSAATPGQRFPVDPGPRPGAPAAGGIIAGASLAESRYFADGLFEFQQVDSVTGSIAGTGNGLGPRFNSDSCGSCHLQPAPGGSSPSPYSPQGTGPNPQVAVARKNGATNHVPFFIKADGPVREARFKVHPDGSLDGGVKALYTISGRSDAPGCDIAQPDFNLAAAQNNLSFRIPTPVYGAGLIEAIPDAAILANQAANRAAKAALGIGGRTNHHRPGALAGEANRSGNDGTITRFGWKAQNKSLLVFSGEAYNVEVGVTNDIFPNERDDTPSCQFNATPEDHLDLEAASATAELPDIVKFATFMRYLAPPTPGPDTPSTVSGRALFSSTGCALCHTPTLQTGRAASEALSNKTAHLYSDLLVHHMGTGLDDGVVQGLAGTDEFRTAPLWGLGQRLFFLHDGRTGDLLVAIRAHASRGSEANAVIDAFDRLPAGSQQDILNFLRAL
jgi:CxxC motif-containing protein (DUF1111 family)